MRAAETVRQKKEKTHYEYRSQHVGTISEHLFIVVLRSWQTFTKLSPVMGPKKT